MTTRALGLNACGRAMTLRAGRSVGTKGDRARAELVGCVNVGDSTGRVSSVVGGQRGDRDRRDDQPPPHKISLAPKLAEIARRPPIELRFANTLITFWVKQRLFGNLAGFAFALLPKDHQSLFGLRRKHTCQQAGPLKLASRRISARKRHSLKNLSGSVSFVSRRSGRRSAAFCKLGVLLHLDCDGQRAFDVIDSE